MARAGLRTRDRLHCGTDGTVACALKALFASCRALLTPGSLPLWFQSYPTARRVVRASEHGENGVSSSSFQKGKSSFNDTCV